MTDSPSFTALTQLAKDKHQRLFIHIEGEELDALAQAAVVAEEMVAQLDQALLHFCLSDPDVFSASALASIDNIHCLQAVQAQNKMRQLLGQDAGVVIINAYSGFNPNTLGLSAGCITAGAALIIVSPITEAWPRFNDPDYKRLRSGVSEDQCIPGLYLQRIAQCLSQQSSVIRAKVTAETVQWKNKAFVLDYLQHKPDKQRYLDIAFEDQGAIIDSIAHVLTGHAKRPLILEADRGRGKSTAMGIAAARLIYQANEPIHIAVTAPQSAAVATLFHHASAELMRLQGSKDGVDVQSCCLLYQGSQLQFYAVDQLCYGVHSNRRVSLLLVDEAAAIPTVLLTALLKQYTRLVFSTTVYGYEGNGRGFSLRFKPLLKALMPQYKQAYLTQPMRWSNGDMVETVVNDLLLLDAERQLNESTFESTVIDLNKVTFKPFTQRDLLDDSALLESIFSLLVSAHYQTSGDDLRLLLDHPDVRVMTLMIKGNVVAVMLLMLEGNFSAQDKQLLLTGHRRFRGHLLPQQGFNAGFDQALDFIYARVMRIAVNPSLQRCGLGTQLLNRVEAYIIDAQMVDFYGASFAAEPDVVKFWQRSGFDLQVLGSRKDSSSGLFTVTVMKCVSKASCALTFNQSMILAWQQNLSYQLLTQVNNIQVALLPLLYKYVEADYLIHDLKQVENYCQQRRGFEVVKISIYRFMQYILSSNDKEQWLASVDEDKIHSLLEAVLLNRCWHEVAQQYNYNGRKAIETAFRDTLQQFVLLVKLQ